MEWTHEQVETDARGGWSGDPTERVKVKVKRDSHTTPFGFLLPRAHDQDDQVGASSSTEERKASRRIVMLLSGLSAHGGIQRHNRTLSKVVTEYAARENARLDVYALHDPDGWLDARYLDRPLRGYASSRTGFTAAALMSLYNPSHPCNLVIVGHVDFMPLIWPLRKMRPHSPILCFAYGTEVWTPLPIVERLALRSATRVSTISQYTADQLVRRQGIPRSVIDVVPIPLDPDFLADVAAWRANKTAGKRAALLSISRLSLADTYKGIDRVIEALPGVRAQVPTVNYTVIGDGDDRTRLVQLAREHGVADIVNFIGRVSDSELHAYLSEMDVFVLPSLKEGFGIVFLEAMAYSKPVIAGNHGGSPEVVVDGVTGLLVHNGDHDALVQALVSLLLSPLLRQALGDAGYTRLTSVYGYETFHHTIIRALDDLLGRN